jgi:hypothetical protein
MTGAIEIELHDWLQIIQAEYLEIPGLHLTRPQVQRLWGLDEATCDRLLGALLASRFLRCTDDHGYVLAQPTH